MITVTKKNSQLVVEKMHKTSIIMNTLALNRVATLSGNLIFNNLVKKKPGILNQNLKILTIKTCQVVKF